jgi:DnaK suppressor protein
MQLDQQIKDRLLARRRVLLDRYLDELDRVGDALDAVDLERIGRSPDRYDARILLWLGDTHALEVDEVTRAIDRFDAGSYGRCVKCSHDIGAMRLDAMPAVALCFECAARAESKCKAS